MIPDTSNFMIAGYGVFFIGIVVYVGSIVLRTIRAQKQIDDLKLKRNPSGIPASDRN
jgi:hypothetical protein